MSAPSRAGRPRARAAAELDAKTVWAALEDVKDPEVPVLSVVELGMVRDVAVAAEGVRVDITPTFAGCPAFVAIAEAVRERVSRLGAAAVEVRRVLSPAWSSDAITAAGRAKLHDFGLAPPAVHGGALLPALEAPVPCPHCGSLDTQLRSAFGSALCREFYTCRSCQEAFERFKPV
ncbi:MAG: phenylacetate-CoA oxygenase subunit PaaJ [Deinococcales bacterium]